jgi:polysaccharide export outer membrane protein
MSGPTVVVRLSSVLLAAWALAEEPAAPASPGSPDASGAVEGYRLGPEDVIEVFVWKEPDLSTTATVRPDGWIALPLVGELRAEGRTPSDLKREITAGLERFVELPVVTVMVKEIRSPKITVLGNVKAPGRHLVPQPITVLDAIAMSGGFNEWADRDDVVIVRRTPSGTERIRVDVKAMLRKDVEPVYLKPGDTVDVD